MQQSLPTQTLLWRDALSSDTAERPTEAAYWRGSLASRALGRNAQKALGQFMTPPPIARLMAEKLVTGRDWKHRQIRLLDPAAGSGVLASAMVEAVLAMPHRPAGIELLMFEIDAGMQGLLAATVKELTLQCSRLGVEFRCQVEQGDFLLSDLARRGEPTVDAVIANPPYFKLSGGDERAKLHGRFVHGQPNIYGLFMGSCAALVRQQGAYCFITPRSWTNGGYFRALRACLDESLSLDALHLFDSRVAHFKGDAVLQEALIAWASAGGDRRSVAVSSSAGAADLDMSAVRRWPYGDIVGPAPLRIVTVPVTAKFNAISAISGRLNNFGLKVSTGPVVGFRAKPFLSSQPDLITAPMLWMQHVHPMKVDWPRNHRAEHIRVSSESAWMLFPNRPMVVLRRFSPKESPRRVTAAPYLGQLSGDWIGLENHLNVVHSPHGSMSADVACGLAAYLNSEPVDAHLRDILGSTQVNAVELRELPVPDLAILERIGREVMAGKGLEDVVSASLNALDVSAQHA